LELVMAEPIDIVIHRGRTFEFGYLYAEDEPRQVLITGMPSTVPLRITVPGHGLPDGWPFWVSCVKSPRELNTSIDSESADEVMTADPYFAKVVDENTIEIPSVVASCWGSYQGRGVLITRPPVDLTGWSCRAQVRDKPGGKVLFTWHSDPDEEPDGVAIVDVDAGAFFLQMTAEASQGLQWRRGVYDVEAIAPGGEVYSVAPISSVQVSDEVTAP
jgi:hypothetical protein